MTAVSRRLVPSSPTRAMCEQSLRAALRAGAIAPAVMAGLLLELHDGVVSHALDEARSIAFRQGGLSSVVDELEQIQREERGEDGANG